MLRALITGVLVGASPLLSATAQTSADSGATGSSRWHPYLLGTQINVIAQDLRPMRSPYEGPNSLTARGDSKISHAYGVYGGVDADHGFQAYLDVEMVRGMGISRVVGLAGPTNGDVLRQGTADLGSGPYVARAFVRYVVPLASR